MHSVDLFKEQQLLQFIQDTRKYDKFQEKRVFKDILNLGVLFFLGFRYIDSYAF